MKKMNARTIAGIGILTAMVIVLQVISSNIKFGPFSITLALMPIVVGAAIYGWKAGAWLGFVFGCITLFDAGAFMAVNAPGTVITCLGKGALAGLVSGLVYAAISKKSQMAAIIAAAVACPVVNTGIFVLGCFAFFMGTISEWAAGQNALIFIFTALIGVNFFVELGVNLVLSSVIERILNIVSPRKVQSAQ
ncbi:MAG: ECF transporter S component [Oscillospiraceae bacterium]|nr:ECF transporter S component [Oscillospiraceae bacterium]